ncbi:hypothetical protein IA539_02380 [Gordonia sp. zg691]|uniref:hypothetical protein n=1 Tax=Gordonia jinghuaiqii TaxID=2758710 RepID=UPI001662647E|nr:hypothetical protein [Gordonia jinghuaiqii]MBD0860059.1 hypothetical protein [Gordonia jinghuaiqii]
MVFLRGRLCPTLAALALVAGAATGCGTAGSPAERGPDSGATSTVSTATNVYEQDRAAGVTRLLDSLGTAITAGDVTAIGGLFDAAASPQFKNRFVTAAATFRPAEFERRSGRGAELRFARFDYQLAPTEEAEKLVPGELQQLLDAGGSSDSWVAPVELRYALGGATSPGIAEPEVVAGTEFIVSRHGEDWQLVGDSAALGGDPSATQMWELPGLMAVDVATAGGTSVVASYPDTTKTVVDLRRLLPDAVDAVSAFWGDTWDRRAVVVATATDPQFDALVPAGPAVTGRAAAASVYSRVDHPQRTAVGQRIVFTPAALGLAAPTLGVVLRHELTHIAARVDTAVGAPLWITEGVPEYVGRKGTYTRLADAAPDLAEAVRSGSAPIDLPADAEFAMDGQTSLVAYQSSWSLAAYVADRFGEARLKKLYVGVAASPEAARQDAAISGALGVDRKQLLTGWRGWLDGQVR